MFSNYELIRIYYALLKDTEWREHSAYKDQYLEEIQRNKAIIDKIREKGLIKQF